MGMKANSGFFHGTNGEGKYKVNSTSSNNRLENGEDYNLALSKDVKSVTSQVVSSDRKVSMTGPANSVHTKTDGKGHVLSERYFGKDGKAYLDIDYSDHGNPKMHPTVPHQHKIHFVDDKPKREKKGEAIPK